VPATAPAVAIPSACGSAVAELDRKIASARTALRAAVPEYLFRESPPNARATNELEPLVAAALGPIKDNKSRIECRGSLCRCQVADTTQSLAAGIALYGAAVKGALGPVDSKAILAMGDRTEPILDPATGQRRFLTTYWIPLLDPSRSPPRTAASSARLGAAR
jgi:hypothetical protein